MKKIINQLRFPDYAISFYDLCRLIVGLVFIVSSYHKIIDPIMFAKNIHNYNVTIGYLEYFENIVALVLPMLELVIGILLIFGVWVKASNDIIILLLLFFMVLLAQAYMRGVNVHCGCFSAGSGTAESSELLVRFFQDFILLTMCIFIKFRADRK